MTNGVLDATRRPRAKTRRHPTELRELRAAVLGPAKPDPAPSPRASRSEPACLDGSGCEAGPAPPAKKEPSLWSREVTLPRIEAADLLGARGLAWAGGLVTLLGVVFFFVLAVNRGWIGPVERVALGALASAARCSEPACSCATATASSTRRCPPSAPASPGGYATLLAAAAMYGLVPDLAALAIAAGIAATGTAVALVWNSETVASLGLVGAALVPLAHAVDTEIGVLGTAFAAMVFAGLIVVAIRRGWDVLLAAGAVAVVVQAVWLVVDVGADAGAADVAVATVVWLLLLGAGIARREARSGETESLSTALVLGSWLLAGVSARVLFEGEVSGLDREGLAMIVIALVYGVLAAAWFARDRDLSALLGAVGLTVGAVATAELLGGETLAIAFAAEAALLSWVAYRLVEPRYGLLSLGYLGLAVGHAFLLDVPPRVLFQTAAHPAADASCGRRRRPRVLRRRLLRRPLAAGS